ARRDVPAACGDAGGAPAAGRRGPAARPGAGTRPGRAAGGAAGAAAEGGPARRGGPRGGAGGAGGAPGGGAGRGGGGEAPGAGTPPGGVGPPRFAILRRDARDKEGERRGPRGGREADESQSVVQRARAGPRVWARETRGVARRLTLAVNAATR